MINKNKAAINPIESLVLVSGLMFFSMSSYAGLIGSELSYESVFQLTQASEVQVLSVPTTFVVSADDVEIPMLGDLELDIPNLRLVNASIDIGDNYIEVDYSNAGSGTFRVGSQNTSIYTFDRDAAVIFTGAVIDTAFTTSLIFPDITFSGDKLFVNYGSGGNFSPSSFLRINLTVEPTVVPIPSTIWLFGSGLIGLTYTAKRRKKLIIGN